MFIFFVFHPNQKALFYFFWFRDIYISSKNHIIEYSNIVFLFLLHIFIHDYFQNFHNSIFQAVNRLSFLQCQDTFSQSLIRFWSGFFLLIIKGNKKKAIKSLIYVLKTHHLMKARFRARQPYKTYNNSCTD